MKYTAKRYVLRDKDTGEFVDNYGTCEDLLEATFFSDRVRLEDRLNEWQEIVCVQETIEIINEK